MFDWDVFKQGKIAVFFRGAEEAERFFGLASEHGCECANREFVMKKILRSGMKPHTVCARGPEAFNHSAYLGWYKDNWYKGEDEEVLEIKAEDIFDNEIEYSFDAEGFLSLLD